jgi:hypothetical protein
MDDDDTKIRRNLVVFSAAVLLLAWLEIPFSSLLGNLVGSGQAHPDDWRLWSAGLGVLVYLGSRYSFSAEGSRYAGALRGQYDLLLQRTVFWLIRWQATTHIRRGIVPSAYAGEFVEYIQKEIRRNGSPQGVDESSLAIGIYGEDARPWRFEASFNTVAPAVPGTPREGRQTRAQVDIPKRYRIALTTWTRCWWVVYSQESVRHFFPAILGLAAASLLTLRALNAYLAT